jgi:hypothetical protein
MSKELARSQETAVAPTGLTEIATNPSDFAPMQAQLVEWCKEKKDDAEREYRVMEVSIQKAKQGGFKTRAMDATFKKMSESFEFYSKVLDALELGYMLFPPVQGESIDILAIRSEDGKHGFQRKLESPYVHHPGGEQPADVLPTGEGKYVSPTVHWYKGGVEKVPSNGGTVDRQIWLPVTKLNAPDFPLAMARSQCIDATNRAMVELVFDDIAIYPARATKDPVILGRIFDPVRRRWLNFLISWRIDKRDL